MGSCMSSESSEYSEQRKKSQAIDRRLDEDSRKLRRECKILLLGSGESGKSTIVKQMKIIHQNGYTVEELALYRLTVYKNLMDCVKSLIGAYHQFNLEPTSQKVRDYIQYLSDYNIDPDPNTALEPKGLLGSFFEEAKRIASADYIPNVNDVLRARTKTTGIYETRFSMGQLSIHMFDVGGQRSERKKWIHCFENVTSIIFCVALSEYDQVLLEESNQNRMMESLVLFDSVVNSRWFMRTSIILFLNKVDLFRQKLPRSPLSTYFPDYSGGNDVNRAAKYLLWRFNQVNRAHLNLYPHLTQATDTTNIRLVFAAVKETILQNALKDSGIL
ncbi:Guanine nucleotide-binding protein alpha-2 subunit [Aspergillus melleus]|uniref:Guanine nucleotide-binding protein alpha-2 subunit n=1 Tax=Aspergillus melleus TaxID=138277 RepID=A0ACC3B7L8_9EURO|nr:Guanine nucleotide-binding protein alpha-2 subunit [Aspergillus melleus]